MNPFYGLGGEEREEDINSVCCPFGVPGLLIAFVIPKLSWLAMLTNITQAVTYFGTLKASTWPMSHLETNIDMGAILQLMS